MGRSFDMAAMPTEQLYLLLPLPPLRLGIPNAIGEQPIQIGKVRIAVDEEIQAFAIVFARPLASPHLPSRIIGMEVRTAECRPAAMRAAFNVAAVAVTLAYRRTAIRARFEVLAHCFFSARERQHVGVARRIDDALDLVGYPLDRLVDHGLVFVPLVIGWLDALDRMPERQFGHVRAGAVASQRGLLYGANPSSVGH
jgi:hypothetical protein